MQKTIRRLALSPAIFLLLLVAAACGPLQVGIESAAPAGRSGATDSLPATPSPDRAAATIAALETANAGLASQVATLTAAQAPSQPPPTQPTSAPPRTPVLSVRITFPPGSASATVSPDLAPGVLQVYVLKVLAGQHLLINADHDLQLEITGPDGRPLAPLAAKPQQWDYAVTKTGDQTLAFSGAGHVTITIYVPPLATPAH